MISKFDRITRNVIFRYLSYIGDPRIGEMVKLSNNRIYSANGVVECYSLTDQNRDSTGSYLFVVTNRPRLTCIKFEDKILWFSQCSLFLGILQQKVIFWFLLSLLELKGLKRTRTRNSIKPDCRSKHSDEKPSHKSPNHLSPVPHIQARTTLLPIKYMMNFYSAGYLVSQLQKTRKIAELKC